MSWEIVWRAFLQLISSPVGVGLIVAGAGWLLGKYIYTIRRERQMLVAVFYISTGVLAFAASSWLAYGFYYSLYEPKIDMPVEKWLLPLDAIEKFLPADLVQDWHKKTETQKKLNDQMNQFSVANKLGIERLNQQTRSPINPLDAELLALQAKIKTLNLELTEANTQNAVAETRVREQLISALVTGKLIARGIPKGVGPRENDQVIIKSPQWQYLQFSGGFFAAQDFRSANNPIGYDALEIGKPP